MMMMIARVMYKPANDNTTPPVAQSAFLSSANAITLVYSKVLAPQLPALSAYVVKVDKLPVSITGLAITGAVVVLTLLLPVSSNASVNLSYLPPAVNPIKDAVGNISTSLTNYAVSH